MRRLSGLLIAIAACAAPTVTAEERVITDDQGRIITVPVDTPAELRNPWPEAQEQAFLSRRSDFIKQYVGASGVNTALENEKQGYPPTMLAFCAGDREEAINTLQSEDAMAGNHAHTKGIDYYWGFTIKGQMRKYFFFGQYLDPAYKARMKEGGAAWTAKDPRPNTELVLLTDTPDAEVNAYALAALVKMWRGKADLLKMADEAEAEGHNNKKAFAAFIRTFAEQVGEAPPSDTAGWRDWWAKLCRGDWMVFEEYDRRTNTTPHPQFGIGKGPVGTDWSPKTRGGIVDWRNTDNLRGMREVAVYLMAEEAGNDLVRRIFKERIRYTARNYMMIGNGEWDSPAYLSHTASAYVNLYDFAKDPEVRLFAKAILDYVHTSAAVKYFQGAFGGPNCRDYGTVSSHSGPSGMMHFWVGEGTTFKENDIAHYATSAYRPPMAVVALARKEFKRPVEFFANHPPYQTWLPGKSDVPMYHETQYIANHYQIGSQVEGGSYDVSGAKILVDDGKGHAEFFVPSTQTKGNICVNRSRSDRFAQNGNLLLCLSKPGYNRKKKTAKPVVINMMIPKDTVVEQEDDITFLKFATSYAAVHGVNATMTGVDAKRASKFGRKGIPGMILAGAANDATMAGYAIEMGEDQSHGSYADFKTKVKAASKLAVADGAATFTGTTGSVGLATKGGVAITRNGQPHDLATAHRGMWRAAPGGTSPVTMGWREGVLHVEAGGHSFTGTMDIQAGTYSFTNTLAQ